MSTRFSLTAFPPAAFGWAGAGLGALAAFSAWGAEAPLLLLAGAGGGFLGWYGRTRLVSSAAAGEPRREAAALSSSLSDLTPLLEALPDPALLVDSEGRVAGSNAAARRQLEFEAAGLFLSSILRYPALLDAVQAASHDGATQTVEYETTTQVEQHIRCTVAPVTWGGARGALAVFHDQTSRINTERMRSDFLANASHELRTPLASLTLLIETIAGPARDEPEQRDRFLKMMQVQADRMRRLIDDLLSLSRIEMDEHVPPSDRADLGLVAREVADALTPMAKERGVVVNVVAPDTPVSVIGERFQLAQVAQNLIDNAIKYSEPGTNVEVEVGLADGREHAVAQGGQRWEGAGRIALLTPAPAPEKRYAYLRVADTGPGVPRRFLPRLGERFFRVEREMGEEKGGTGLGLAIVKHIINRHRGGLAVESVVGRGCAFAAYVERAPEKTGKKSPQVI